MEVSTIDPILLSTKRVVFVGGIPVEKTTVAMIRAMMIPFGNIQSIDMPMDYVKGIHRGFAFVEYETADDADEAIFNLDGAELLGQTISVSVAQPNQIHRLSTTTATADRPTSSSSEQQQQFGTVRTNHEAIWTSDEWFQQQTSGGTSSSSSDMTTKRQTQQQQEDIQTLQSSTI